MNKVNSQLKNKQSEAINEVDREEKIKHTTEHILSNLSSGIVITKLDRVAWILNHHPECRNSDIKLMLKYWETFESDIYNGHSIYPEDLYKLTRLTTISRERAKLQNTYKLFQASQEVREHRGTLSDEEREKAVEDRPDYFQTTIYMDDSGKTSDYLIVGSIWFLTDPIPIHQALQLLRKETRFTKEFHYSQMARYDLPVFNKVLDIFWQYSNSMSFKFISTEKPKVGKLREAFTDMYYHLFMKGAEHEHNTGRAQFPRWFQVWIDEEGESLDNLMIANLDDRIRQAGKNRFDGNLRLDHISTKDSKANNMVQLVDLFTGSVNRVLNHAGISKNHKDLFAEKFLDMVGIDLSKAQDVTINDLVFHIKV